MMQSTFFLCYSNNTVIQAIKQSLNCNHISEMTRFVLSGSHTDYFGHIFNLIVKAILFETIVNLNIKNKLD